MFSGRLAEVPLSSFARLNQLIKDVTPQSFPDGSSAVAMTVGEPQDPPPDFITEIVHGESKDFGRYPPLVGTVPFRAACAEWLCRRFNIPKDAINPDTQVLPLNGSREGLFFALFPLVPESKNGGKPVVLIPNPFYSVYPAATIAAGAEAYYVPARRETGFLPDFEHVPESVLRRTVAAYFCSPSNPGERLRLGRLLARAVPPRRALRLHRARGRMLLRNLRRRAAARLDRHPLPDARRFRPPALVPLAVQALERAGPALGFRGGTGAADRADDAPSAPRRRRRCRCP